jgi:hypothetical protein
MPENKIPGDAPIFDAEGIFLYAQLKDVYLKTGDKVALPFKNSRDIVDYCNRAAEKLKELAWELYQAKKEIKQLNKYLKRQDSILSKF